MYERFYRLRERPFALTPDPDYLYPSRVHREALDYLTRVRPTFSCPPQRSFAWGSNPNDRWSLR